eukprot:CAMPEP_0174835420 /NCGR_PEP_ID=MMETSP1114-20130205/5398_1 /TAXON_ID=312471 /ORGANISM="Neobodo designis, Strain CCAP 1951/1" /LENGTH=228 /DNA_ID=CAMNT_0016069367 /DNA_START=44 /DNA_END=728 /DNA_ORIENTATION=-
MSDAPTAFARPQNKLLAAVRPAQITFQKLLDRSVPHTLGRWIGFACLLLLYILRVALHGGFYVVTYGMCVHLLYLLVLFLTPLDAPADDDADADAVLASKAGDEFKPYVPKVQEFKVWYGMMRVVCIAFACTLFERCSTSLSSGPSSSSTSSAFHGADVRAHQAHDQVQVRPVGPQEAAVRVQGVAGQAPPSARRLRHRRARQQQRCRAPSAAQRWLHGARCVDVMWL